MTSVIMVHPKAKEPVEVIESQVPTMINRGWKVKGDEKPVKQEKVNGNA